MGLAALSRLLTCFAGSFYFVLSWQVVPTVMSDLVGGPDPEGSKRAMAAMMTMKKIDIQKIQDAYDGK